MNICAQPVTRVQYKGLVRLVELWKLSAQWLWGRICWNPKVLYMQQTLDDVNVCCAAASGSVSGDLALLPALCNLAYSKQAPWFLQPMCLPTKQLFNASFSLQHSLQLPLRGRPFILLPD